MPLSREERWEIVWDLLRRDNLRQDAERSFRVAYPELPKQMIDVAIFHTYVDGLGAAIDWLVALEQFLRNPSDQLHDSRVHHLLYHLYNWHQLQELLPDGRQGVLERLADIKALAEKGDIKAVQKITEELELMFDGNRNYPTLQ